jgi:hypothetical protein
MTSDGKKKIKKKLKYVQQKITTKYTTKLHQNLRAYINYIRTTIFTAIMSHI